MKEEIHIRIRVLRPLSGVTTRVQRGRREFLEPVAVSTDEIVFEFPISVDLTPATPNFLGPYVQGPKDARFIYVNSGKQAGQEDTCWDRRVKISLMAVSREQIKEVRSDKNSRLGVSFSGVGRDGGPTCASVKGIEWKVVNK